MFTCHPSTPTPTFTMTQFTPAPELTELQLDRAMAAQIHRELRRGFDGGAHRPVAARRAALQRLRSAVERYEDELTEALLADLNKPPFESYTSEIGFVYQDIDHTLAHLDAWTRARKVSVGVALFPTRAQVFRDPKGVALVIAPWNYPFNLAMAPLVSAVAAGCCVALKPGEDTPHTARVIEAIVTEAFAPDHVRVVQGPGAQVVPTLMAAGRFDHVFYTGSTGVGREIGERCGRDLIPCTLELGGKSPAIVFADAALDATVDRIVWGKCYNLGQTCVAPDYVLVQDEIYDEFLARLRRGILEAYGEDPQESPDLARVINDKHFGRLRDLLAAATVYHGGQHDASDRFVAPSILTDVELDGPLMTDEIFGPLLPVLRFDDWEEAKSIVALNPDPLAAYAFTQSDATAERFVAELRFGGGCINDTVIHLGIAGAPFGGVGTSGHGRYHGEAGIRAFTYEKTVARTSGIINLPTRYAPYRTSFLRAVKWLLG